MLTGYVGLQKIEQDINFNNTQKSWRTQIFLFIFEARDVMIKKNINTPLIYDIDLWEVYSWMYAITNYLSC